MRGDPEGVSAGEPMRIQNYLSKHHTRPHGITQFGGLWLRIIFMVEIGIRVMVGVWIRVSLGLGLLLGLGFMLWLGLTQPKTIALIHNPNALISGHFYVGDNPE